MVVSALGVDSVMDDSDWQEERQTIRIPYMSTYLYSTSICRLLQYYGGKWRAGHGEWRWLGVEDLKRHNIYHKQDLLDKILKKCRNRHISKWQVRKNTQEMLDKTQLVNCYASGWGRWFSDTMLQSSLKENCFKVAWIMWVWAVPGSHSGKLPKICDVSGSH